MILIYGIEEGMEKCRAFGRRDGLQVSGDTLQSQLCHKPRDGTELPRSDESYVPSLESSLVAQLVGQTMQSLSARQEDLNISSRLSNTT